MRTRTVDVKQAVGRVLFSTILKADGSKLFVKGHRIDEDDLKVLTAQGITQVTVGELEQGEVGEDEAALQVARKVGSGCLEIRPASGGRANSFASGACCVLVDDELLKLANGGDSLAIATVFNFSYARAGRRIATVKSRPFAMPRPHLDSVIKILKQRGPILQARPFRTPSVAVLYCDPVRGERARELFEKAILHRLRELEVSTSFVLSALEDEAAVTRSLEHLLRVKPTCVLIASTTAPADPEDVVGRAIISAGCRIERFLAPVDGGNLLLLAYKGEIPIVSAPGCFRSVKTNIVDLILPPLLAKHRVSSAEIARLGHGGLLALA
jgi:molybdenum cofactor cytidylyltransferase